MKIQKIILSLATLFFLSTIVVLAMPVDGETFVLGTPEITEKNSTVCIPYTRDLTIGSTGADVVKLQNFLEKEGYLTMPAGVAKGYFGSLVQSALAAYQSAVGISPANGYFGPITRASLCSQEEQPSLLENLSFPTSSRGALKAYALSQVHYGVMNIHTKYSGNFERTFVGETPQDIVDQFRQYDIEFNTVRPEDEVIQIPVYLRGSPDSRTLFSGQANNIKPQKLNNQWMFPNVRVSLVMQESVPFEIPEGVGDTDSVEVRVRDQYGFATKIVNLAHYHGTSFFPARLAGEFGELVFIDSKGQEFSYDLGTGKHLAEENFEVEYSLGIENYKEETLYGGKFNDFWPIALQKDNGGRSSAPVYRLDVREETGFVYSGYVYHQDKNGDVSVYLPKAGHLVYIDDNDDPEIIPLTNGSVEVQLNPGKYMLWIEYEVLEVPGSNSHGGKG